MIVRYARLVALPHTVFALPFAVGAAMLAYRRAALPWSGARLVWIVVAVAALRTAAMAWNRVADRGFDRDNPRTAARELPSGEVSVGGALALAAAASALFFVAAAALGRWPLGLAPLAWVLALGYSLAKRFTWASHFWLGAVLGGAPLGAALAATGKVTAATATLALAVACWVAGFDLIYSCQDADFDRRRGLRSVPARFGVARALRLSAALHVAAVVGLALFGVLDRLGPAYFLGSAAIAAALVYEHRLVSADDLRRVDRACFTFNGWVSVIFAACALVEALT
jgi:4-hydroxybenzoate polyprenyltransferase